MISIIKDFTYPEFMSDQAIKSEIKELEPNIPRMIANLTMARNRLASLKEEQSRRKRYEKIS